nr:MAG TPA: hypothetical protein [Caudoviricetes sp.]
METWGLFFFYKKNTAYSEELYLGGFWYEDYV